jgi:hypothetical protein
MERCGPAVGALVLGFLERTTFAYGDMVRTSNGQCMLDPQLARAVVASYRAKQARVQDGAKQRRVLLAHGGSPVDVLPG